MRRGIRVCALATTAVLEAWPALCSKPGGSPARSPPALRQRRDSIHFREFCSVPARVPGGERFLSRRGHMQPFAGSVAGNASARGNIRATRGGRPESGQRATVPANRCRVRANDLLIPFARPIQESHAALAPQRPVTHPAPSRRSHHSPSMCGGRCCGRTAGVRRRATAFVPSLHSGQGGCCRGPRHRCGGIRPRLAPGSGAWAGRPRRRAGACQLLPRSGASRRVDSLVSRGNRYSRGGERRRPTPCGGTRSTQ